MAEAQRTCEGKKQFFLSYCHSDKDIVHRVADELIKLNYKIWIDRDLIQGNFLFADIQNGIENSHVVICFISKNYCDSQNCLKEITLADTKNKKLLPIMLDNFFKDEKEGIQFMISRINKFYAYKTPETFSPWNNNHFETLKEQIFKLLTEVCPTCSKKIKSEKPGSCSKNSILNDKNKPTGEKPAGIKSKYIFEGIINFLSKIE
jgi:hypothetical protein